MIASTGYNMPFLNDIAKKPMPVIGADPKLQVLQDFPKIVAFFGYPGPVHDADPGGGQPLRAARHVHAGGPRAESIDDDHQVGGRRVPPDLRQAQARMTASSQAGDPDATSARAAAVSLAARPRSRGWFRTQTTRRLAFGYMLLAPGGALRPAPGRRCPSCSRSTWRVSDASVGEQVATLRRPRATSRPRWRWTRSGSRCGTASSSWWWRPSSRASSARAWPSSCSRTSGQEARARARGHPVHAAHLGQRALLEVDVRLAVQRDQLGAQPRSGSSAPTDPRAGPSGSASRISRSSPASASTCGGPFPFSAIVLLAGFTSVPTRGAGRRQGRWLHASSSGSATSSRR